MNQTLLDLFDYVNSATDLAESIQADLKKDKKISNKTVLNLNKFKAAAYALQETKHELEKAILKNN